MAERLGSGRDEYVVEKLADQLWVALRRHHERSELVRVDRGYFFDVRTFTSDSRPEPTGHVVRVTVELVRVEL